MKIKLPRKLRKFAYHNYGRGGKYISRCRHCDFEHNSVSIACKLIDYEYCVTNKNRGYKVSWPEIVSHKKFKVVGYHSYEQ